MCLLLYAHGEGRSHFLKIKLVCSEKSMRQGRADRLRAQDRRRFEEIFLPYLDAAFNLARWIVQHDQDARDVVQDAYVRAFKGFHRFRGENARAWFLTITRNAAYNWLNRYAAEEKLIPYDEAKHADIILINEPGDAFVAEERKERLQRALERLPLEFREVIVLYELEGLSYKEVAAMLGIPVGTVMSRLSRGRRRLREDSEYGT
jgi:RNA polymerase sigma factor (sigma-70 family)